MHILKALPLLGWVFIIILHPRIVALYAVEMTSFTQNAASVGLYEKYEATFALDTSFENPFDANAVAIDAIVTGPDQDQRVVPAFYYRPYQVIGSGPEDYTNPGPGLWKIRFAPSQTGAYRYDLRIIEEDSMVTILPAVGTFTCLEGPSRGFVRLDPNDVHCLRYSDGSPRVNIGHNVCWTNLGLAGFQGYFQRMGAAKENWTRIWMCHFSNCSILEWRPNKSGYFEGLGRYSLQIAQRLDSVMETAEEAGIGIQLVLQHHGQFSTTVNPNWADNPYNVTRGGMLDAPEKFFTDPEARRLTRNKYRYIVARWGYSPAILAWELWNEVQFTDGWSKTRGDVVSWHKEMAEYLRRIDPQGHLITTSSDTGEDFRPIWELTHIDLVQYHQYGNPQIEAYRDTLGLLKARYTKPVIMGEFGAGQNNPENDPNSLPEPQRTQIREGLVLHNGIWASFFVKSSGHLWWWDTYIHPLDLYSVFVPLQRYAETESVASLWEAPRVVGGNQSIHARPLITDFWGVSTQTEFWYDGARFPGMDHLSSYLHGSSKPDYRSDPTFHLTMPMAGELVLHIEMVSSWGNNRIRILVNGREVLTQMLVNGASNLSIAVSLHAGEQKVQIENTGQDWVQVSEYEFRPSKVAIVNSLGLVGPDRAYLWIYDGANQYGQTNHGVISKEAITVQGLNEGRYEVTVWDTSHEGGILSREQVETDDQILTYTLPDFTGDIALKIKPTPFDTPAEPPQQ